MTKSLLKKLTEYGSTHIPMHMPGHKRNFSAALPYDIDITEINGFDNLHDMQGVLKETADLAASLYGAKASFPLVNGSTCGILAAMHALCPRGSHILMSRNSHKSVYHGVELLGLIPHYVTAKPDKHGIWGSISPADMEHAFCEQPDISLMMLTSPTYEGVVQDVEKIADICHRHGAYLVVDSAHGAHFGFSEYFPQSAVTSGADAVIMSLHKTMPALTQTALLHICSDKISVPRMTESLRFFETSSPSYVLLASIDECLRYTREHGKEQFSVFYEKLSAFYEKSKSLRRLRVFHYDDRSKIIISAANTDLSGLALANKLRKIGIETEMACADYILAMTSICDKKESFDALSDALFSIDAEVKPATKKKGDIPISVPEQIAIPADAKQMNGSPLPLSACEGKMALESVWAYPPGIPLIVPGERITAETVAYWNRLMSSDVELYSTAGSIGENKLLVI